MLIYNNPIYSNFKRSKSIRFAQQAGTMAGRGSFMKRTRETRRNEARHSSVRYRCKVTADR